MKVLIEYDETTGLMMDSANCVLGTWLNLVSFPLSDGVDVEKLIKLKNAGYTADEIIQLRNREII